MPGIPREVAKHSLHIRPNSKPVKQRLRRFDELKRRAIGEEVQKLLVAGFIKEVFHPDWLANLVLVKKKNGKWRMRIDYTGLNKAYPKVPFLCHELIKSLIQLRDANFYPFSMHIPVTTKSR